MILRNRVKKFREIHGLTQDELAQRTGVSSRMITLLETDDGNHAPRMSVILKLCEYFNVDLGRLFWTEPGGQSWLEKSEEEADETEKVAV